MELKNEGKVRYWYFEMKSGWVIYGLGEEKLGAAKY